MSTTAPLTPDELQRIRAVLKTPRDRALLAMGVNTAFRGGDILSLNRRDVELLKAGDVLTLTEAKTAKRRSVLVNERVYEALQGLLAVLPSDPGTPLFQPANPKHAGERLTVHGLGRIWKAWAAKAGIEGKTIRSHSGRKTAAVAWKNAGVPLSTIMQMLNHSSEATTARYLGITQEHHAAVYSICV